MKLNLKRLVISLALPHLAGLLGSLFTPGAIQDWYQTIEKPAFNPPDVVFAPVWLALYTLMGIALYLVWQKGISRGSSRQAFRSFLLHLIVNAAWSIVFFGGQSIGVALVILAVLWIWVLILTIRFFAISRVSGLLLIPYLLWVSFALYLNYAIWTLN